MRNAKRETGRIFGRSTCREPVDRSLLVASMVRWVAIIAMAFAVGSACAADFNVAAAISLKTALEQAKPELERVAGGKISFDYGASGTLAVQIRQGMPVDLFISADKATMNGLVDAKLVDAKTVTLLAGNQLVLVVPSNPRAGVVIHGFGDLTSPSVQHVAIGEPKTVPAGAYAVQTLQYLKLYDSLAQKDTLIKGENVAQVLAYVVRGEVDAGFVYHTDAMTSTKVQTVATAPEESHEPIVYMMGIVSNTQNGTAAQSMEQALLQEKVQKILTGLGFVAAPQPATSPAK